MENPRNCSEEQIKDPNTELQVFTQFIVSLMIVAGESRSEERVEPPGTEEPESGCR